MEIIVNLDVMMAKRKIGLNELHSEKQQGQGRPVFHTDGPVP